MRTPRRAEGVTALRWKHGGPKRTDRCPSTHGEESVVAHPAGAPQASLPAALTAHAPWLSVRNQRVTATYAAQRISAQPTYPTAAPNRLPRAYVTPAAAPPSASCRSPLNHQVRAVTRATTAPHAKSPSEREQHGGPQRGRTQQIRQYGQQRAQREGAEATTRRRRRARAGRRGRCPAPRGRGSPAPARGRATAAGPPRGRAPARRPGTRRARPARASSSLRVLAQLPPLDVQFGLDEFALRGDGGVLAGGHGEGAGGQPREPGDDDGLLAETAPPATPVIRARLETRPSIAPKTAGRSQPPLTSRWVWLSRCASCSAASVSMMAIPSPSPLDSNSFERSISRQLKIRPSSPRQQGRLALPAAFTVLAHS